MEKDQSGHADKNQNRLLSLPGACPRISIFIQIEVFRKNKHSHIGDIEVYAIYEHYFCDNNEELGENAFSDKLLERMAKHNPHGRPFL
jgi:hypothetical protein